MPLNFLRNQAHGPWKLPVLAGVLLAAGYYSPLPLLNLVAFLPLLLRLDALPPAAPVDASRSRRWFGGPFGTGMLFGFVAYGTGLHFFLGLVSMTWLAGLLWFGFSLAIAVRVGLQIALIAWLRRRTRLSYGLLLPLGWVPFEYAQTFGDLRMSGDHLAYGLTGSPFLVQFADLIGPYGVSIALLAAAGLLYESLYNPPVLRGRPSVALAVLVGAVLLYDAWAWFRPIPEIGTTRIALVQPNISLDDKMNGRATAEKQQEVLERLTRQAARESPDLIVWPESARPRTLWHFVDNDHTRVMPELQLLARELGIPILAGVEYGVVRDEQDFDLYNAAMLVDAQGRIAADWAAKVFLVPFVEATPWRGLFGRFVEGRGGEWAWLAGRFLPGPEAAVMQRDRDRIGVQVCFEQLFPARARALRNAGANVQIVITNDAWWGTTAFQGYQADALRFRAIENRTAIVRVANTGISGFLDARGRYEAQTPLFEEATRILDVPLHDRASVYSRVGDLPAWVVLLGLAFVAGRRLTGTQPRSGFPT